jgi:hypothetical protein
VIRILDKKTGVQEDKDIGDLPKGTKDDGDVAFTYRSFMSMIDYSEKISHSEVDIEGAGLQYLLRKCIGSTYPGINLDARDTVNIQSPYEPIVRVLQPNGLGGSCQNLHANCA